MSAATVFARYAIVGVLFGAAFQCVAQPRVDAEFEGLSVLSERDVESELRTAGVLRPDIAAMASAVRLIEAAAMRQGLHFTVATPGTAVWNDDSSEVLLRFLVDEGPLLRVCSIEFSGDSAIDAGTLLEVCDTQIGSLYSDAMLAADVERMLDLYDRSGHPFASLRVASIEVSMQDEDACADIGIAVDEGAPFFISEFTVEGNTLTSADVIIRETRFEPDALYDAEKVNDIRRTLERLQFFSSVAEPQLYLREGKGGRLLRGTEGNPNVLDGVIGYQPPRLDGEEGYVTGLVNLSFRNLFGTGRRMDARWERATQRISELEFRYLEPWLFGFPVNIQGGLYQRQQDSSYVRRAIDAGVTYLAGRDFRLTARGNRIDVIPSEFSTQIGLTSSTTWTAGLELLIDTRDDVYNPRTGIQLRNSFDGGTKHSTSATLGSSSDFVQRIEVDAAAFREIVPRVGAAVALHGRELRGGALDVSDLYRLGGAATLRGYREEQFAGTRLGWISNELRYSLGRRSFTFVFYDFGYIFQSRDEAQGREEISLSRGGYGLGLRIETGLGVMGVSYALGTGDGLGDGKIHFGLVNEF